MIDSYEGDEEAENRLVKMVSELTNWNFDIDTVDKKDPYKCTLLHYSSMVGVSIMWVWCMGVVWMSLLQWNPDTLKNIYFLKSETILKPCTSYPLPQYDVI